jgi:hypothetical protein
LPSVTSASVEDVSQNSSVSDSPGNIIFIPEAESLFDAPVSHPDTVHVAIPEPMATAKLAGFSTLGLLLFAARKKFTALP